MRKRILLFPILLFIIISLISLLLQNKLKNDQKIVAPQQIITRADTSYPMSIDSMKQKDYPGSDITIEETLSAGENYNRYLVSYQSDELKIYGLLTIPDGQKPKKGWPVILLNHGYIPPSEYSTEQSYEAYVEPFAAAGYIVFKPDYRGHGNSEGSPTQIYVSPDYVTDSMNALASVKRLKNPSDSSEKIVNPEKIGVLGHSMGGNISLHELVMTNDFKVAVIASGVVGSYSDILTWWKKREEAGVLTTENDLETARVVDQFIKEHDTPQKNPDFWNTIDPTRDISSINTPVEILTGTADDVVPPQFSKSFRKNMLNNGKTVEYHEYKGADHNLRPDLDQAMQQAISFFDKYLK